MNNENFKIIFKDNIDIGHKLETFLINVLLESNSISGEKIDNLTEGGGTTTKDEQ